MNTPAEYPVVAAYELSEIHNQHLTEMFAYMETISPLASTSGPQGVQASPTTTSGSECLGLSKVWVATPFQRATFVSGRYNATSG